MVWEYRAGEFREDMKSTSAALLAAFFLILSACGVDSTEDLTTTAGAETGSETVDGLSGDEETSSTMINDVDGGHSADESASEDDVNGDDPPLTETDGEVRETLQSALLSGALDSSDKSSSARFEAVIAMTGAPESETPGEFSLSISGAYDLANEASRISIDMSDLVRLASEGSDDSSDLGFMAAFLGDGIEVVTIGDQAWIKWALLTMFTGVEDKWLETSADDTGDMTSDIGIEGALLPTDLLSLWSDAEVAIEDLGVEEIRGAEATHYQVVIDADAFAASMTDADKSDFESDLGVALAGEVVLDVWIDDEGLLHRYVMDLSDPALYQSGDEDVIEASFSFEIWDHGKDLGISAPPAEDIVTEDELTFGFDIEEFDELSEDFDS